MPLHITLFDSESFCGYTQKTTFYQDFSIADHFGNSAIKDTYNRCLRSFKDDYIYLTELVMVLNWKIWEHHANGNLAYAKLYDSLWRKCDEYACTHLKDEELSYFYRTTD